MRVLLVCVVAVLGCGSQSSGNVAASDPTNPLSQLFGTVNVVQMVVKGRIVASVGASFARARTLPPPASCSRDVVGACEVTTCPKDTPGGGLPFVVPEEFVQSGPLTLITPRKTLSLVWMGKQQFASVTSNEQLWNAGQELQFAGGGG